MKTYEIRKIAKLAAIETYKAICKKLLKEALVNSIQNLASLVNASVTDLGNGAYSFYIAQDADYDKFPQTLSSYSAQLKASAVSSISYSSPNRGEKRISI
jgi:hypothetical protein